MISGLDESYVKPRAELKGGTGQGVPTAGRVLTSGPRTSALSFLFREDCHCLFTFADALQGPRCRWLHMLVANLTSPLCMGIYVYPDAGMCACRCISVCVTASMGARLVPFHRPLLFETGSLPGF